MKWGAAGVSSFTPQAQGFPLRLGLGVQGPAGKCFPHRVQQAESKSVSGTTAADGNGATGIPLTGVQAGGQELAAPGLAGVGQRRRCSEFNSLAVTRPPSSEPESCPCQSFVPLSISSSSTWADVYLILNKPPLPLRAGPAPSAPLKEASGPFRPFGFGAFLSVASSSLAGPAILCHCGCATDTLVLQEACHRSP